jgi:hypothetical protein
MSFFFQGHRLGLRSMSRVRRRGAGLRRACRGCAVLFSCLALIAVGSASATLPPAADGRVTPNARNSAAPGAGEPSADEAAGGPEGEPVIPAGQGKLFADMFGSGQTLSGGCVFSRGLADGPQATAVYSCPSGEVVFELLYPSRAPAGAIPTSKFALVLQSGSPPPGLVDDLTARIRARESAFEWKRIHYSGAPAVRLTVLGSAVLLLEVLAIQMAWVVSILAIPLLGWRVGRWAGLGGGRVVLVMALAMLLSTVAVWRRADAPLHANGHAWREAKEVLNPPGNGPIGPAPFLHGKGGIALQWLVARVELALRGTANPFRISRLGAAAAAGATALLAMVLVRSASAGLAAGCVFAFMPLAQMLALSGSVLAVPAWLLPWSLALWIAAALSGDSILLIGAALAGALGTLSHTAMLAWLPALLVVWLVVARGDVRCSWTACGAIALILVAWLAQAANCYQMIAERSREQSLLGSAQHGFLLHDLFVDPSWVSPLLVPMVALWVLGGLRRNRFAVTVASVLALAVVAPPFFAVTACSSDAVRYQGALLGLLIAFAVAGVWRLPSPAWMGRYTTPLLRIALLLALVVLPTASMRQPTDPVTIEHRLVEEGVRRMQPGTLVILPRGRFAGIIPEFPDFLLPPNSRVTFEGDPDIGAHAGPRLAYLGLACISWPPAEPVPDDVLKSHAMRPECGTLRQGATPWLVRSLRPQDIPRQRNGAAWTYHRLETDVPFGFFVPQLAARH